MKIDTCQDLAMCLIHLTMHAPSLCFKWIVDFSVLLLFHTTRKSNRLLEMLLWLTSQSPQHESYPANEILFALFHRFRIQDISFCMDSQKTKVFILLECHIATGRSKKTCQLVIFQRNNAAKFTKICI